MSPLIKRFKEDLQLAGYAKRSIDSYASSVLRLQRFYNQPLEDITEEQLRQYWLCCQSEFGWSAATLRISYAGIQHFFSKTLVRSWDIFNDIKWKREQTLPTNSGESIYISWQHVGCRHKRNIMARIARVVAAGMPHHITQRGNRRQQTFFSDDDYRAYIALMSEWCGKYEVDIWAYCLMPNHIHRKINRYTVTRNPL